MNGNNSLNIDAINPKLNTRYSENLYKWLTKRTHNHRAKKCFVYENNNDGTLWIGYFAESDFFGCKLISVLCNGSSQEAYCCCNFESKLEVVNDFWGEYERIGRCVIDKKHSMTFIKDDQRWEYNADHTERKCVWCGDVSQQFVATRRVVLDTNWVNLDSEVKS